MTALDNKLRRRRASLLWALSARESNEAIAGMLQRHCDAEALLVARQEGNARDLAKIFVDDLKDVDRRVAHPTFRWAQKSVAGPGYWHRRYELTRLRLWQERSATLPRYWRVLAVAEPVAFEKACVDVGASMVGYAALLESPSDVIRWLAPLGGRRARQVVDRFESTRGNPIGDDLANRWHYAYSRKVRLHKGKQIQFALGLELLATARQQLAVDERAVVDAVLDSSIRSALDQSQEAELMPTGHVETVGQLLDRVLASPGLEPKGN